MMLRIGRVLPAVVLLLLTAGTGKALDWIYLTPNPSYSRDLSMGNSTIAETWTPQSQSINPAGLTMYGRNRSRISIVVNPAGLRQAVSYFDQEAEERPKFQQGLDAARLLTTAVVFQLQYLTAAALLSQPVMTAGDTMPFAGYEKRSGLESHQNSLVTSLALHPRVSVGGRIDRYYSYAVPEGEGYSYGVILRPRGVAVGVQYQRFPDSGARVWHPLDRRRDETTSAGLAMSHHQWKMTFQLSNLTQSDALAFLEPRAGIEWRLARALALRAGGIVFSRSTRWAWTAGVGILNANWFHNKVLRLLAPDDVIQLAAAVVYNRRIPVQGIGSLTCAWRF